MLQTKPSGSEIKSILVLNIWAEGTIDLIEGSKNHQRRIFHFDWYFQNLRIIESFFFSKIRVVNVN